MDALVAWTSKLAVASAQWFRPCKSERAFSACFSFCISGALRLRFDNRRVAWALPPRLFDWMLGYRWLQLGSSGAPGCKFRLCCGGKPRIASLLSLWFFLNDLSQNISKPNLTISPKRLGSQTRNSMHGVRATATADRLTRWHA